MASSEPQKVKGFVPTPPGVVDAMVAQLFHDRPPRPNSVILDPGCGTGVFIHGIVRWCRARGLPLPRVVGIEQHEERAREARHSLAGLESVVIRTEDFLRPRPEQFDYAIGNPPYVSLAALSELERADYRRQYRTARGRFDLYVLFFEEALRLLKPGGRLVYVILEKFLYVRAAAPLRQVLGSLSVEVIEFQEEATFQGLTTYPVITSVVNARPQEPTTVRLRDGQVRRVRLPADGSSWLPILNGNGDKGIGYTLADICSRVSCGVATGADAIFVTDTSHLTEKLRGFAHPTLAGREISSEKGLNVSDVMLIPYENTGELLPEHRLGELGTYLRQPDRRQRLLQRTCVRHKPWYAFHETPPLPDILRPKILCKDIASRPFFVMDETGQIVPRHSVYYIVPKEPSTIHDLCEYLNSPTAYDWLTAHCQRAANGYIRLQSHVLKRLPVPGQLAASCQLVLHDVSVQRTKLDPRSHARGISEIAPQ